MQGEHEKTRASYNQMASWYDRLAGPSERPYRQMALQRLQIGGGPYVLDVGCGTGQGLLELAQKVGAAGHVYGLDLAEGMLAVADERVRESAHTAAISLVQGDALRLPFPSNRLDVVTMNFTLELFPTDEMPVVLAECHRVLRHAGRLAVVSLDEQEERNLMTHLYIWAHRRWPHFIDCRPIPVESILRQANFQPETTLARSMWGLPVKIVIARPISRVEETRSTLAP